MENETINSGYNEAFYFDDFIVEVNERNQLDKFTFFMNRKELKDYFKKAKEKIITIINEDCCDF